MHPVGLNRSIYETRKNASEDVEATQNVRPLTLIPLQNPVGSTPRNHHADPKDSFKV